MTKGLEQPWMASSGGVSKGLRYTKSPHLISLRSEVKAVVMQLVGYIDAGTGSYLLAAIAGGVAGMWFYIRGKIDRLRGRKSEPQTQEEEELAVLEEADPQDG